MRSESLLMFKVFDHGFGVHQWNVSFYTMFSLTNVCDLLRPQN
jgi:hypothetical protein